MDNRQTEFYAIANSYVGNFKGQCMIQLNGQAIVILNNRVEINRWPYNCIRQFRAEDETGKFSFVSGRRGPYGVAEYNFTLHSDSLIDLQAALTEFTGAQFSAIAPGSDPEQQPLQPQEPLPPYPTRHANTLNSYITTTTPPRRTTMGSRTESTSSDLYPDSVFNSPARQQPPKLPPRPSDYTYTDHTSRLSISADEASLRANLRGHASTSASSLSGTSLESGSSVPRPALPPPRPEANKEPSPEVMVAKSMSYEETRPNQQAPAPVVPDKSSSAPTVPTKKKSFFNRHKTDHDKSSKKSSKSMSSLASDTQTDIHSSPHSSPPHTSDSSKKGKSAKTDHKVSPKRAKKESPYDHLPSEVKPQNGVEEPTENHADANTSPPMSPAGSDGKHSPTSTDDFSTPSLPRSSPILQQRPEHAQHLKKEIEGRSATMKGRHSPPSIKPMKKSNTMSHVGVNAVGQHKRSSPPLIPTSIKETDIYNVPRPSSANDVYKVPKSMLDSPPTTRSNGAGHETYDTPKSTLQSNLDTHGTRVNTASSEGLYKVPTSVLASESSSLDTYDSPRPQASTEGDVYNVPRSSSDGARHSNEGVYNVPPDAIYNTPRPARSHSPTDPLTSQSRNDYESIDINAPRKVHASTLRPARSFESLHKFRVNNTRSNTMAGPISPPAFTRPKCEYVDIDLPQFPAKNAPLPPLPKPAGPNRVVDSVYAEISEADIAKNRQMKLSQGSLSGHISPTAKTGHALYDQLPPSRPYLVKSSDLDGMAKAKELNEEEGYELCLPAMEHLKRIPMERVSSAKSVDSAYPPVTQASVLMEKYNINIHESSLRARPFSESDVLDDQADASKLGTSIPLDIDSQDEYVIVTGSDRRPKPKSYTVSHNIPGGVANVIEEEQYETMSSARVNLSAGHAQYSTPNPSLGGGTTSSVPQPEQYPQTVFARRPSPQQISNISGYATPLPDETVSAGIDLNAMSPSDENSDALYTNFQHHHRQPLSPSASSDHSVGMAGEEEEAGQFVSDLQQSEAIPLDNKASMVKIMEGSPLDRTSSTDLKALTRSHGNVLDHRSNPTSPTSSSTGDHTPPTSLTPPIPKRHEYVNCKPAEEVRGRTVSAPKNKRPRPSPRSALLNNREEGTA